VAAICQGGEAACPAAATWASVGSSGIRIYAIGGLPFSFIYRIDDDRIEILRLWDQRSQRGEDWIDR
jgi:hypothetical protein